MMTGVKPKGEEKKAKKENLRNKIGPVQEKKRSIKIKIKRRKEEDLNRGSHKNRVNRIVMSRNEKMII